MAAARRRKAPPPDPGSAGRRLAQTIAFHRWTLATPIDDHFMTPEQMRQMPLPPEPAPQSRKAEPYLITRVTCTLEVPSEERLSILAAARWPLAGIVTLTQGKRTRTVLAPGVYLLSSPLTEAERRELQGRQDTQLREFDEGVAKTRHEGGTCDARRWPWPCPIREHRLGRVAPACPGDTRVLREPRHPDTAARLTAQARRPP